MSGPRVVHVMGWHSQQYGSFERFLVVLARRCREQGAETHLVFPAPPASGAFVRDAGAPVHVVPLAAHPADPRALRPLGRLLREVGATHAHVHFGLDAYLGLAAARAAGVRRRFATKHLTPGTSRRTLSRTRHRWLARQVEALFAVSRRVRDDLVALGVPPARVEVCHLGVDTAAYRPDAARRAAARAELGAGEDDRLVVGTSHLRPGKGAELLPGLAASLAGLPARVLVAGDGPLRGALEREARALGGGLRLLGVREDVPDLLAAADLYVFPTTGDEGLPLAPLEALAAGVPVVASAVSDLGELLGDGDGDGAARLVVPGDRAGLARACRELLEDPAAAAALGARGRALAVDRLDVGRAAQRHAVRYFGDGG